jgi:hypothetical protein
MSLVKTDYGLVYNTDGILCYTERTDDTPFQGVKSYAVEEKTQNYMIEYDSYLTQGSPIVTKINDGKRGHFLLQGVSGDRFVWQGGNFTATTQTITGSYKFKIIEGNINDLGIYLFRQGTTGGVGQVLEENIRKIDNKNIVTITFDGTETQYLTVGVTLNGNLKVEVWEPQMEEKSFPTSFVDGNRLEGDFKLPIDLASKDDFVLNFWIKMNPYYLENSNKYFSLGDYKDTNNWNFSLQIRCYSPNLPYIKVTKRENVTITQSDKYEKSDLAIEWAMVTFIYDNGIVKIFYNGLKVIENILNIPNTYGSNKLWIGHPTGEFWTDQTGGMGLISDLFTGEYKNKDGKVIWTDEFIRERYENKRPFSLPPKLPII